MLQSPFGPSNYAHPLNIWKRTIAPVSKFGVKIWLLGVPYNVNSHLALHQKFQVHKHLIAVAVNPYVVELIAAKS